MSNLARGPTAELPVPEGDFVPFILRPDIKATVAKLQIGQKLLTTERGQIFSICRTGRLFGFQMVSRKTKEGIVVWRHR